MLTLTLTFTLTLIFLLHVAQLPPAHGLANTPSIQHQYQQRQDPYQQDQQRQDQYQQDQQDRYQQGQDRYQQGQDRYGYQQGQDQQRQDQYQDQASIVMTMIVRDEAVNFKSNLHLWLGIVDYFVFLLDSRTQDGSEVVIAATLSSAGVPYEIIYHEFDGFGSSRTRSLENAWKFFPQATYVWIADPDWRPEVASIDKQLLLAAKKTGCDALRFTIVDRSGITTRQCDWLLRHRKGLAMRYHLHEVIDIGTYLPATIPWVIHEVEQPGSWHTTVGHDDSFSPKRTLFDLELLYKDLAVYGHDPHTHKYLGVTHLSYVVSLLTKKNSRGEEVIDTSEAKLSSSEVKDHLEKGNYYCGLRVDPATVYDEEFNEERWECMVQMALTASVMGNIAATEKWYTRCHEFSPSEPRCMYSLASFCDQLRLGDKAFQYLQPLLTMKIQAREGINFRAMDTCLIPKLAFAVLLKQANENPHFPVTNGFVLYLRLLMKMMEAQECQGFVSHSDAQSFRNIIDVMTDVMGIAVESDVRGESLCVNKDLQEYIHLHDYTLHNCV